MSQRIEDFRSRGKRQCREDFSQWEQSAEKLKLPYPANWHEEWRNGGKCSQVKLQLFNKYPRTESGRYAGCPGKGIFTDNYVRIVTGQPTGHFPECLAAVHYYKERYQVLVEKYSFPVEHEEMARRAEQVLQPYNGLWPFLVEVSREAQPPDLLVYRMRNRSMELFFVEVKHKDRLKDDTQKRLFPFIDTVWHIPIKIVRLVPGTPIPF